jgi:hypothetical protein
MVSIGFPVSAVDVFPFNPLQAQDNTKATQNLAESWQAQGWRCFGVQKISILTKRRLKYPEITRTCV